MCFSVAVDCWNECFSAQAHVFFPFSLSCLCSLFAELNGSPVTKKYKRTEKNELFPWKWIILWKVCKAYRGCALLFRVLHKDVFLNAKLLSDCVLFLLKSFYKILAVRLFVRIDISPVSTTGTSDRNVLSSVVTHTRSIDPVAIIPPQTLSWRTRVFVHVIIFCGRLCLRRRKVEEEQLIVWISRTFF